MKGGQQAIDLFLGDDSNYVKLPDTGGVEIATQNFNQYSWIFGTDGDLIIPGDIKSQGNINIDINLSDSTLRRWQFGEDGILTLPSTGKINNGNYEWQFGTDGTTTFPDGYLKVVPNGANPYISNRTDNGLGLVSGSAIQIRQSVADAYGISIDSSTTDTSLGGGALLASGSNIDVNGTKIILGRYDVNNVDSNNGVTALNKIEINNNDILIGPYSSNTVDGSTVTAFTGWTFNKYGTLTFPDATVQTTAWTGVVGTQATLNVTGAATAETFNTDQITIVGNRITTTVTNANLEIECNGTGGVVINTVADATTASTTKSVGYLGLPQSATATSATLAIGDAGKHIYVTTNSQTITIPAAASVDYPIGTTLTFIAGPDATTVSIAITSDTLRLAGGTSTGTRTLAANGMATAVKVAATTWYINGVGLT
jgi:hypothetical protein